MRFVLPLLLLPGLALAQPVPPPVTAASIGAPLKSYSGTWQGDLSKKVPTLWSRSPGSSPSGLSAAGDPGGTAQVGFTTQAAGHDFQAVLANIYTPANSPTIAPNPITVSAAWVYPATAAPVPMTIHGQPFATIAPNGIVKTDPIAVSVPAGASAYVRTLVRVSLAPLSVVAATGTGGTLANSARYYKVTTLAGAQGESGPSAEVSATPAASGTVTLAITPDPLSVTPTGYNIYAGTAAGGEVLLATVPAAANGAATSWTDTGATAIPPAWVASTAYALGAKVTASGTLYVARVAGTSGTTAPSGGSVKDGTVTWVSLGTAAPPAAQQYPLGGVVGMAGHPASEAHSYTANGGTGGNFLTVTGSGSWGAGTISYAYAPLALMMTPDAGLNVPVVAILGDSISVGYNESSSVSGVPTDLGYIARALQAGNIGYWMLGRASERLDTGWNVDTRNRRQFGGMATDAIVEYGINDIILGGDSLATLQASAISAWQAAGSRAPRVWATTLTPVTTSTDGWTTAGNQTPNGYDAVRQTYNTWVRAGTPMQGGAAVAVGTSGAVLAGQPGHPLSGVFDPAALVEVNGSNVLTLNGGRWYCGSSNNAAYTRDGTHPYSTATVLMAAAINTTLFTAP